MTDKELMARALEFLEDTQHHIVDHERHAYVMLYHNFITALKERLAQPEQEPYAYTYLGIKNDGSQHGPHLCWKPEYMDVMSHSKGAIAVPLYTHPPQRTEPICPECNAEVLYECVACSSNNYPQKETT